MIFPWPWAPYIPTLCIYTTIISGIAQDLVPNNLSLLSDCQLLIFPMEHGTDQGTFFTHSGSRTGPFLKSKSLKNTSKKKFKG